MEEQLIQRQELLEFHPKTSFTVISKGRVVSISFNEITHVSKYGSETIIYAGANKYKTYLSLQEILNDLPVNEFFRIHRSHIVSLQYMKGMKRNRIMVNGFYLAVSKYYKEQLCKKLAMILDRNYLFITSPRPSLPHPAFRATLPSDARLLLKEKGSGNGI